MTKSTITRERLEQLADNNTICKVSWDERIELAQIALAAMDSEPVAFTEKHEISNMHATGLYLRAWPADRARNAVEGYTIPLYLHAQPASEYPEVLPCPVLLEPGLRFGKGIKTSTMLAALARRAVYESDMAALSPEERAEFQAGIEDFKALIAQPAPVVPEEMTPEMMRSVQLNSELGAYAASNLSGAYDLFAEFWKVACRAAMLQASPVCTCPSGDGSLRWPCPVHAGNSPVIGIGLASGQDRTVEVRYVAPPGYVTVPREPTAEMISSAMRDNETGEVAEIYELMLAAAPQSPGSEPATVPGKWIPVSERMPIEFEAVIAFDGDQVYGEAMYSSDDGFTIDGYDPCDRVQLQNVTHWMLLPAAPQEVKGE
ncbi:Eaa1 [Klebsiella pneumoniae]|nr:Eaa1 [Klebsiella pneumoniae]